jgi:CRISPR system Cascade subunit CasD
LLSLGISDNDSLLAALQSAPWQAAAWYRRRSARKYPGGVDMEIVHDANADEPGAFTRRDAPESFSQEYRRYAFRFVIANPRGTTHDPMAALEGKNVPVTN